jgi:hypothetical protein
MADEQIVQPDAASTGAAPTAEPPKVEPAPQPSQDEIIKQTVSKLVAEELAKHTEVSKREIQSIKDRSIAEVERARKVAEDNYANAMRTVAGDDPELQTKAQLAAYQAQARINQQRQYEDMSHRQQSEFDRNFKDANTQFVTDIGLDLNDKRIDWGDGEGNYLERMKRIQKSVAVIAKEERKTIEEKAQKTIKEELAKLKKEFGIDSVDTSTPSNTIHEGIPTNRTAFEKWVAKLPDAEYKKLEPKISQMMDAGLIK